MITNSPPLSLFSTQPTHTMATRKSKKSKSKAPNDENSLNYTLNDSYWMDSFDKLVEQVKKPLRERNIFKRNVRVSYNRDSSLENPTTDEEELDGGGLMVVASTPRFKSAPRTYSKGGKSSTNGILKPSTNTLEVPTTSKLSVAKNMFFNFISTPSQRKTDQSLNLSVIVSSEGEGSIWKRVSFPNISNFLQNKRRSDASPVAGEEGRKILKTPDKKRVKKKRSTKTKASKRETQVGVETNARKSEKPRVLFDLVNDSEDAHDDGVAVARKTEIFVLKPGKWRKSMANMRKTIQSTATETAANNKPKQSLRFALPEAPEFVRKSRGSGGATGAEGVGRWTRGDRVSQYHPGRRRKSIFIAHRPETSIVVEEVDGGGVEKLLDQSQDGEFKF